VTKIISWAFVKLVTTKAAAEHELLFDKSEPQIEDFVIGGIGGIVEHLSLT